jgi:hypothetical protein
MQGVSLEGRGVVLTGLCADDAGPAWLTVPQLHHDVEGLRWFGAQPQHARAWLAEQVSGRSYEASWWERFTYRSSS